jgi:hypothetical protein
MRVVYHVRIMLQYIKVKWRLCFRKSFHEKDKKVRQEWGAQNGQSKNKTDMRMEKETKQNMCEEWSWEEKWLLLKITGLENCPLLGYYAASVGLSFYTFLDNLSFPSSRVKKSFLTLEDGTDFFSPSAGKEAPLLAA